MIFDLESTELCQFSANMVGDAHRSYLPLMVEWPDPEDLLKSRRVMVMRVLI